MISCSKALPGASLMTCADLLFFRNCPAHHVQQDETTAVAGGFRDSAVTQVMQQGSNELTRANPAEALKRTTSPKLCKTRPPIQAALPWPTPTQQDPTTLCMVVWSSLGAMS